MDVPVCLNILPTGEHLVCSKFLSITNKAALKICVQLLCEPNFSFLWDKCPGVQLLGHMVSACLVVLKTLNFSRVAISFHIPSSHI